MSDTPDGLDECVWEPSDSPSCSLVIQGLNAEVGGYQLVSLLWFGERNPGLYGLLLWVLEDPVNCQVALDDRFFANEP